MHLAGGNNRVHFNNLRTNEGHKQLEQQEPNTTPDNKDTQAVAQECTPTEAHKSDATILATHGEDGGCGST